MHPSHAPKLACNRRLQIRGFALTELIVVIGVIAVLMGILIVALAGVRRTTLMTESMSSLRQINTWMNLYSGDNREFIVPSQFDYSAAAAGGSAIKVRSHAALAPDQYMGTWTDILWTVNEVGSFDDPGLPHDYRFDSPDSLIYDTITDYDNNPFRAAERNQKALAGGTGPTPFGSGAQATSEPGFFAANQFFDSTVNGFYTTGQIKAPAKSLYLIDSHAGETIEDEPEPWDSQDVTTFEPDFRYNDNLLILYLDGRVDPQSPWRDLDELEQDRGIRVRNLDRNP